MEKLFISIDMINMKNFKILPILITITLATQAILIPKPLSATAQPARCLLQFYGATYINEYCELTNLDKDGFEISNGPLVACDKNHTKQLNIHQNYDSSCAQGGLNVIKKVYFVGVSIESSEKASFGWGGEDGFRRRWEPRFCQYLYKNGACWENPKAQMMYIEDNSPVKPKAQVQLKSAYGTNSLIDQSQSF